MIDRFKETLEKARAKVVAWLERIKEKILAIKESITRQKIMNILGVYVDEDSEEEVEYDNALKEILDTFLLRLYYGKEEEECEV